MAINIPMPACLPTPSIDFTQKMPSTPLEWASGVSVAGYYYVNMATGSDTDNPYGNPDTPRARIPSIIPKGSLVVVDGEYAVSSGGVMTLYGAGTDENWVAGYSGPVWITNSENGTFARYKIIIHGDNIFVDGITCHDGTQVQIGSVSSGYPANKIVFRNSEVEGIETGGTLISITGADANSETANVLIYNNYLHHAGDIFSVRDQDAHISQIGRYTENIWMIYNEMYHASGSGLQINAGNTAIRTSSRNIFIGGNHIHHVRQSGLWVKFGKDMIFSSNHIEDIVTTTWSVSKCMGAQYCPDNLWMINNHVHGAEFGIRVPSTYDVSPEELKVYMIGNIIYDISTAYPEKLGGDKTSWQNAAINLIGAQHHYIYNNLIFDAPNGIGTGTYYGQSHVQNNIILDVTRSHEGTYGYHLRSEGQDIDEELWLDNNYFGIDMKVRLRNAEYETVEALAEIGALNNLQGADFINGDDVRQMIEDVGVEHIDLTGLIDKGIDVSGTLLTDFQASFPGTDGVNVDLFGMYRVLGGGIDIGPFETGGVYLPTIPNPPTDVYVDVVAGALAWRCQSRNEDAVAVLKNGVQVGDSLAKGTSSLIIPGISDAVDTYQVVAESALGNTYSEEITSDVITIDNVSEKEVMLSSKSYLIPRQQVAQTESMIINHLTFVGQGYGVNYAKPLMYTEDTEVARGFVYVLGSMDNAIAGSIIGTGRVEILTVDNNYAEKMTTADFIINDSVVKVANAGRFQQRKISIEFTARLSYRYVATTDEVNSAIGISAIIET